MSRALVKFFFLCLLLSSLGACSTWMSLWGDEEGASSDSGESRAPASSSGEVAIDNSLPATGLPVSDSDDRQGPNLSASEFNSKMSYSNDASSRGYRRNASPWDGLGPTNEGSLWDDTAQDNFYFVRNNMFRVGDIIVVTVEQGINDTLNTRISALVNRGAPSMLAAATSNAVQNAMGVRTPAELSASGAKPNNAEIAAAATKAAIQEMRGPDRFVDVDELTVRITEILPRNTFRVSGGRRVYIRNAPYQLKLNGIVRSEDVSASRVIASGRVLDSKLELTR